MTNKGFFLGGLLNEFVFFGSETIYFLVSEKWLTGKIFFGMVDIRFSIFVIGIDKFGTVVLITFSFLLCCLPCFVHCRDNRVRRDLVCGGCFG